MWVLAKERWDPLKELQGREQYGLMAYSSRSWNFMEEEGEEMIDIQGVYKGRLLH